jgi:hypothetical protein
MPDHEAAKRRLLVARIFAYVVLGLNLCMGLAWLLASPDRSMTAAYLPARQIHKMVGLPADAARWWGGLLVILALFALAALIEGHDRRLRIASAPLVGYWIFWALAFAVGAFANNGGIVPIFFALMCATGSARAVVTDDSWERVK